MTAAGMRAAVALFALSLAACSEGAGAPADTATQSNPLVPELAVAKTGNGAIAKDPEQDEITQCAGAENVIFSCTLANGKLVSICSSGAGGDDAFAQYRIGRPGEVAEMSWPTGPDAGRLAWASVPYSGGGEAQISFARGSTRYVVYSRMVRTNFAPDEPNDPAITDGVMVLDGDAVQANLVCDDSQFVMPVDYDLAERQLDKADDLFSDESGN